MSRPRRRPAATPTSELIEAASPEGLLVDLSAKLGLDLSRLDLDAPLDDLHAPGVQGIIEQLKARGDGHATLRAALPRTLAARFTGTAEEIADELALWRDAGIDGFTVMDVAAHSAFWEFAQRAARTPSLARRRDQRDRLLTAGPHPRAGAGRVAPRGRLGLLERESHKAEYVN